MPNHKPNAYAFIDSQNLNLGIRSLGWRIDYKKFRLYLKNKYNVEKAFMFIGMVVGNQELYKELQAAGFILVFKPTVQYFEDGKETVKGNVDAELVLHASAIEYENYEKAIIVTGDGDFACLVQYLLDNEKLLHVFTPTREYSRLLKPYAPQIVQLNRLKRSLQYTPQQQDQKLELNPQGKQTNQTSQSKQSGNQKDRHQRSVETLGLSGHGDTQTISQDNGDVKQKSRRRRSSRKPKDSNQNKQ